MPAKENLPSDLQDQFEQAIRDVISGVSHANSEIIRELPDPSFDDSLEVPGVPELQTITVESIESQRILSVTLYFNQLPKGDGPVVPDDIITRGDFELPQEGEQDPTHLRDLGGDYAELSDALIGTLTSYCDAPSASPDSVNGDGRADFVCTLAGDGVWYSTLLSYPQVVEKVYGEGRADLARRFGLPF